ncbi:DUF998 domain-containing protein [Microlunatus speluncae]|uniref:DUF998 domain-containing protein n=1 Tax=Microlunatus speluncae TaxID=2594267 RepID=UPI001375B461|nr:DUF998 domain-containing protein [Microlunatus speluncae]
MIRRLLGGCCWIAAGLLMVAELIAAVGWAGLASYDRFEPWRITISDLGATGCAVPDSRYVDCSPFHPVLDLTLIMVGLLIIAGGLLSVVEGGPRWPVRIARGLLVVCGLLVSAQGIIPPWNAYGPESVALAGGTTAGALAITLLIAIRRPEISPRRVLRVLGLIGLLGGLVFLGLVVADPPRVLSRVGGVLERIAVYPVLAGLILLGVRQVRRPRNSLASTAPAA